MAAEVMAIPYGKDMAKQKKKMASKTVKPMKEVKAKASLVPRLCCSLVIVCREYGQWEASFIREKSACLAEVSVTEQIIWEFPYWEN